MEVVKKELELASIGRVKELEPMSQHTTIKIGGPADLFVEPSSIANLLKTMEIINGHHVPWRVVGRGSNLLVSDKGINGVVIKLGQGLDELKIDDTEVTAGGGQSLISLATTISRGGLKGFEFAGGIPGSVGGAVYMNAGAHGSDISKILKKAHILFEDGKMEWLTNEELEYSYRTSILQKKRPGIVLEAVFQLQHGNREEITKELQKNKDYRKETQPWNFPCAGSIFRNPLPNYAGRLVESAGLKGHQIGGAQISEMHGNFIVNTGNATAEDVLALIQHVKDTISSLYDIRMETEVEIVGRN
ncbi:UDP-N-acetylmuramate dehydrogenase [Neobacillus notoginsengisoli]|uniref:UDP-N-acetylenolpyruvoylglucosamine reductase n=1 Tax=Neobacillus notoginsengisoli TaxID=1578198 RepID=A0A417YQH4_9BACI|nr:UDP-N-acetylmuramate dehydrogenase [Neobacillus notoginsengisoli]RHW36496.1 UDP-N-acetylmuramate dehydrogenase [Neobacillus notoginsengisoli]